MTEFFQSLGMNYEWAWFVATIAGILLIALPLMLSVAMIIYVDRKVWRRSTCVAGRTWSAPSACCKVLLMV